MDVNLFEDVFTCVVIGAWGLAWGRQAHHFAGILLPGLPVRAQLHDRETCMELDVIQANFVPMQRMRILELCKHASWYAGELCVMSGD